MTTFRTRILYADAVFLIVVGGLQFIFDQLSYAWGTGPLGDSLHDNNLAIGFVEAHGLAFLIGLVLLAAARHGDLRGNGLALVTHLLLGASNITFWAIYSQFDLVLMGVLSTAAHIVFVLAHAACLLVRAPQRVHS